MCSTKFDAQIKFTKQKNGLLDETGSDETINPLALIIFCFTSCSFLGICVTSCSETPFRVQAVHRKHQMLHKRCDQQQISLVVNLLKLWRI